MGHYRRGDVILAAVAFEEPVGAKTRPAIVISAAENGDLQICPVSSRPPAGAPCIPISLNDFSEGGLDLFSESYVLNTRIRTILIGEVIGRKGRLTQECMAVITAQMHGKDIKNSRGKKGSG